MKKNKILLYVLLGVCLSFYLQLFNLASEVDRTNNNIEEILSE